MILPSFMSAEPAPVGTYSCAVGEEQKKEKAKTPETNTHTHTPPWDLRLSPPKCLSRPRRVTVSCGAGNLRLPGSHPWVYEGLGRWAERALQRG